MKKIILIYFFLFKYLFSATLINPDSWQISPYKTYVQSTDSGLVKLKAISAFAETDGHKYLTIYVKKEDDSDFTKDGTIYLNFANGARVSRAYQAGNNFGMIAVGYDKVGTYYPYSDIAQGTAQLTVQTGDGATIHFPEFTISALDPININAYTITSMGTYVKNNQIYQKFRMSFSLSKQPIVIKIETDAGGEYYFLKSGQVQTKESFIDSWTYSTDKRSWDIDFSIKQENTYQNKYFKLIVQDYRAKNSNELIDSKQHNFTVAAIENTQIDSFTISTQNEDSNFQYFNANVNISAIPKTFKIESYDGDICQRTYLFYENGEHINQVYDCKGNIINTDITDVFTNIEPLNNNQTWNLSFHVKKTSSVQSKTFKAIAVGYNDNAFGKETTFYVNKETIDDPLNIISYSITPIEDTPSYQKFKIFIDLSQKPKVLSLKSDQGTVYTFYQNDTLVKYIDWQNKPTEFDQIFTSVNKQDTDAKRWDIEFIIYKDSNIQNKNFTLVAQDSRATDADSLVDKQTISYQVDPKEPTPTEALSKIRAILKQSNVLNNFNLDDDNLYTHHLSRAEATLLLFEFLKLKDPNFTLPYSLELYNNTFADLNENSDIFHAVTTLANYKGYDSTTVLTKRFGVFNPLQNTSRFEFVKMVIEAFDILKTSDDSRIQNYQDYNTLTADAKVYFATAVKENIIQGDSNQLLPYEGLTIFQGLTILQRLIDKPITVREEDFETPDITNIDHQGTQIGLISDIQMYDPDITPIHIETVTSTKADDCVKLSISATKDINAYENYIWYTNFGYFQNISSNNKEVLFCPSTRQPNTDYQIEIIANDGYMNFDEYHYTINKETFLYHENIADTHANELNFNILLSENSSILKENMKHTISKQGSLYKDGIKIGLEKVSVTLENNGQVVWINHVNWDTDTITFWVPSIPEFYGKRVTVTVEYGTNAYFETYSYSAIYQPDYIIRGYIEADEEGIYPTSININGHAVYVNSGQFLFTADKAGRYTIDAGRTYTNVSVELTDEQPVQYVSLSYIDLDYDNDGIENDKDTHPYDGTISEDSDNDGYLDIDDAFPNNPSEWKDTDNDGIGDNMDNDNDNDGYYDGIDAFPYNPTEWLDTDNDGTGDNIDEDDDNDGIKDTDEIRWNLDPKDPTDAQEDFDGDGIKNVDEIEAGSDIWNPHEAKKPIRVTPIVVDTIISVVPTQP